MGRLLRGKAFKAYSDLTEYSFVELDTSHTSYPDVYVALTSARGDHAVGITEAAAESDHNEIAQLLPLVQGEIYPILLGETVAVGEYICPGADGKGYDADTGNDVIVGTCVKGGDAGDIGYFVCDTNFGRVVA